MRHAPVTLSRETEKLVGKGGGFDLFFCTDMLNLAEFKGLTAQTLRSLPTVAYFHENQLTYPSRFRQERDLHFGFTNFVTSLAADRVWFNSRFHRDSFMDGLTELLKAMPDYNCLDSLEALRGKSEIRPQGVDPMPTRSGRRPGPPRLLWAARWEYDKNPELLFAALYRLLELGLDFRVNIVGERFAETPPVFAEARQRLGDRIERWGYLESREDYVRTLLDSDIVLSTASHEFFGVSVLEAAAAGCRPVLPRRLAYPELFGPERIERGDEFFYDGTLDGLVRQLAGLLPRVERGELWIGDPERVRRATEPFWWGNLAPRLDTALDEIVALGAAR